MCGITGMWRRGGADPADRAAIRRMSESLVHRGPDDFGYLLASTATGELTSGQSLESPFAPDLLLASRRLAIVDLTPAGRMPVQNETGEISVVFNGAIHNYLELRRELEGRGHTFHTHTDTEVIVHGYEEWGEACAARFNGMWAYALWDARTERLICSRDRFGIKPFFVAWDGETFYFGSEAKAILAGGGVRARADVAFLRGYLAHGNPARADRSAFEGITQLAAGHNLVVTRDEVRTTPYWRYTDQSERYDTAHPETTFRELFGDAVRLRLRADVPVALLLSGGLDSSSIAQYAAPATNHLEAFTAVFPGFSMDEQKYAEVVARERGIPLHCIKYEVPRLFDDWSKVAWHLGAPPARGSELVRWQLLEAVSRRARVVLEGQGADEMLAGYPERYTRRYLRAELQRLRPWNAVGGLSRMASAFLLMQRDPASRLQWPKWRRPAAEHPSRSSLLAKELRSAVQPRRAAEATLFADPLTRRLHHDHAVALLPELLQFGDAYSMAHSVESRLPFLDHRLVEFV
ncbi:MAG: asparagine synthase (glutamine-hydrolyzing), partial [Gemmatimonadales bacterium]